MILKFLRSEYGLIPATVLWLLLISNDCIISTFAIALFFIILHNKYFVDFAYRVSSGEWPYNLMKNLLYVSIILCLVCSYLLTNQMITSIVGFHQSMFQGSSILLTLFFSVLFFFAVFPIIIMIATLFLGFSANAALKIVPLTFIISISAFGLVYDIAAKKNGGITLLSEKIINNIDFGPNARLIQGFSNKNGIRINYSLKICGKFDNDALIAPLPQGGYIVALARKDDPRKYANSALEINEMPTRYAYKFVDQKECPTANDYYEYK